MASTTTSRPLLDAHDQGVAVPADEGIEPDESAIEALDESEDEDAATLAAQGVPEKDVERFKKRLPNGQDPAALWKTFRSSAEIMEFAAEQAADMVMGEYVDRSGRRWNPGKFVVKEIMRNLGYGSAYVKYNQRPAWWPERGTSAFTEYVMLKCQLRRESGLMRFEQIRPFMESLLGLSVVELLRRLKFEPEKVSTRDLSDILSRTSTRITHGADQGVSPDGTPRSAEGREVFAMIFSQAARSLPEGTARDQLYALFQDKMREVSQQVSIPAVIDTKAPPVGHRRSKNGRDYDEPEAKRP